MSLSLLTLSLLPTRPAQAQTPGYWAFDHYGCQGGGSGTGGRIVGPTWSYPWASTVTINPVGDSYGDADTSTISVTITPFFRWVPGSDPSAPPSILYAKITSAAYAYDDNGVVSVSANNGFGDKSNQPPPGYSNVGASSVGSHLEHKDPQGQTLVSLPPQTLLAVGGFSYDWRDISTEVDYQVETDNRNRAVTISCPAVDTYIDGGSQYRDPPLTGPVIVNTRMPDGTLRGDTVQPTPVTQNTGYLTLSYQANVYGSWATDSSYLWRSANLSNPSDPIGLVESGTFVPINIPYHIVEYNYTQFPTGANSPMDHIYIHLIDSADGANATANYYMQFHNEYEPVSWPEDTGYPRKQTTQIDPDVPSWPTYSWHAETNPDTGTIDSVVGPAGAATTFPFTGTETQSWHLDGGLGIAAGPVDLHFGGGYDKDITNTTSGTSPALPAPLFRGQKTWAVWRKDIRRHKGHLDIYGTHGYISTGVWYRDEDAGTERDIYYPYADAATENAHDPAPDWNPGG